VASNREPIDDIDGDGIADIVDPDMDGDGIPNEQDPDDDNDGVEDSIDPTPPVKPGTKTCAAADHPCRRKAARASISARR
jgi:hypothetical protein